MIIHRYVQVGTALERALARVWPAAQSGTMEISDSIVQDLVSCLENFQEHRFSVISREFAPMLNYPPSDFSSPLYSAAVFRHRKAVLGIP